MSYVKTAQRAVLRWAKFLPNWMPLRDRYWSAAKGGIALRAAPELIGEIAKGLHPVHEVAGGRVRANGYTGEHLKKMHCAVADPSETFHASAP